MTLEKTIEKYALLNAFRHDGKASAGSVIGAAIQEMPEAKNNMKELAMKVNQIIKKINSMSAEEQKEILEKEYPELLEKKEVKERTLPELKNVGREVVMRIAPYPSGPLHIGNAKQLVLNDEYVKKYSGKLILVYDDTIGSEEKNITKEAYELIKEGALFLECNISHEYYKSDRLNIYYDYAVELIKKGKAYVCFCKAEELRGNRAKGLECDCRNAPVEKNLEEWKKMREEYKEGDVTLRLKTDMQHKNPAFRDRVLFRIAEREHPRVGNKYRVWPLLDFSWAIDDHLLNITHILRGKDLMIETEMERYIWDILGWHHKEIIHTGLWRIEGIKMSKSKSKKEVMEGIYIGWDDPRTWSLQSLRRRGIKPLAIRKFCLDSGLSMNDVTVPIDNLYSKNRELIEMDANRYFFIDEPVEIKIENAPKQEVDLNFHPDFPERGQRLIKTHEEFYIQKKDFDSLKEGKLYRLMDCLNFKKIGSKFVFESLEYFNFKDKGEKIMHWLPKENVKVEILMDDAKVVKGLGEEGIKKLKQNETVQFERFGYCKFDGIVKGVYEFWYSHK